MKTKIIFSLNVTFALLLMTACKVSSSSSTAGATGTSNGEQKPDGMPTPVSRDDLQDFYEIVKDFYLDRAEKFQFKDEDRQEIKLFKKFDIPLGSNQKIKQFSQNMFDFIESGNYSVVLYGIPRRPRISALPLKGMTDKDLFEFLQVVKTEYFKYIAGVQTQNFSSKEVMFYSRIQGLPPTSIRQAELLIIAGDLFDKIETGK